MACYLSYRECRGLRERRANVGGVFDMFDVIWAEC